MTVVVVGAGHAAGQFAASLRQFGSSEPITLIGDEPFVPYQRPPLSKQYLQGEFGLERVTLRPEKYYDTQKIEVQTGMRVTGIDPTGKCILLADESRLEYSKLVLATGSEPIVPSLPGIDATGVFLFRTLQDVDAVSAHLSTPQQTVIIGGGYIGLEVAASLTKLGHTATVVELEDRVLKRVASEQISRFCEELHQNRGVRVLTNTAVTRIVTNSAGKVSAVECADGTRVETTCVVVGVGIRPATQLAEDTGIDVDDGIVVDEYCQTSAPEIYAIGDCTNHPNPLLDRRLRLESVPNAMEQGRTAARNISGEPTKYATYPWFWSDQFDIKLQMVGLVDDCDELATRGSATEEKFAVFYVKNGLLQSAEAVNSPQDFMVARQLIGKEVDSRRLGDPLVPLKELITPK